VTDVLRFTARRKMTFNPISISGYHMREAGASAVQEIAFTFANALEYVRRASSVGVSADEMGPRLSFFFAAYTDLFEEIAKFRAARRLWARLMKEKFNAGDAAARLRFHTQTGGATLTAQQPLNNVVRVAIQAMAAVLGGTQSLHTNSYDEALALPTEHSATLALRTQQLLAHETGIPDVVDPLGGSWYVEALTEKLEAAARALVEEVEAGGGSVKAIERGYFQDAIARSAYGQQHEIEEGRQVVVGVNEYVTGEPVPPIPAPDYSKLAAAQCQRLAELRKQRDLGDVKRALGALEGAARDTSAPLMEHILDAVRARATLGEISDVLRAVWGVHDTH
jgi:methylmalonyl-CoA mutase, N-terminal domain